MTRGLERLAAEDAGLASALQQALAGDVTPEEAAWVERIEAARAELVASDRPLEIQDYGAGTPDAGLSEEEMRRGRTVIRNLGEISKSASKPPRWCRVLFRLVRELRPTRALELGACVGVSAAYQAAALELNRSGTIVTLEGAPALANEARATLAGLELEERAHVEIGRFADILPAVLSEHGPFDLVFVDGHHDQDATLAYFEQLLVLDTPPRVVLFDDITWSPGMANAWDVIANDDRVRIALSLGSVGLCACDMPAGNRLKLDLPYDDILRD